MKETRAICNAPPSHPTQEPSPPPAPRPQAETPEAELPRPRLRRSQIRPSTSHSSLSSTSTNTSSSSEFNYDARVEALAEQVLGLYSDFDEQVDALIEAIELLDEERKDWEAERRKEIVRAAYEQKEQREQHRRRRVSFAQTGSDQLSTVEEDTEEEEAEGMHSRETTGESEATLYSSSALDGGWKWQRRYSV